jgi:hypothetical protein
MFSNSHHDDCTSGEAHGYCRPVVVDMGKFKAFSQRFEGTGTVAPSSS